MRNKERIIMMGEQDLKQRTKEFALRVIRVVEALPKGKTADVLGRQLLRCGTSVGAIPRKVINGDFLGES
jgi:hypothetical protein